MAIYRWVDNITYCFVAVVFAVVFVGILSGSFIPVERTEIPSASVWSPLEGQTPTPVDQVEEERKFKEVERVAQVAWETAGKLAPENPPRYWQAEKVIFQTDSVWVILKEESGQNRPWGQEQTLTVGLVIHKSHEYYADWLGFASTAASGSDNRLTTRLPPLTNLPIVSLVRHG